MSGVYENRKTIRILSNLIEEYKPKEDVNYYFILGYPRSDIGKGTLVAQLLATTKDSDVIKFDGLLNTNANGRHTAVGHDDFGVYERFNQGKRWGREHYLLGGELYRDFIHDYGEYENLQINPHMSLFVEYSIHKMWNDIGRPKTLFIEVGGLITDPEVDPIFTPMIQRLTAEKLAKVILLSESGFNGEYIKTKTVQACVNTFLERRIEPYLLFARDVKDMNNFDLSKRLDAERIISNKIKDSFNYNLPLVITVPFFDDLDEYTKYINKRFVPIISKVDDKNIVLATKNKSKIEDFKLYIGDDYNLSSTNDYDYDIDITEGMESAIENALAKARTWCKLTNKIAIGDDTGFFMHALNGEPGVATRRWGGELNEDATNEDFWNHLQEKTKGLDDLSCHFEQCIAVVSPNGKEKIIKNINEGILNKDKLKNKYNGTGYPLGAVFESTGREKNWDEMTDEEKKVFDSKLIEKLKEAIIEVSK